ncbi:MAG: hypothetical protein IIZ93_07245 [Acidaminococcaceae bacterium]|nr:hypothetical protein [Acidaminococcaceae bacterium]
MITLDEAIEILSRPKTMNGTPQDILEAHDMAITALRQPEIIHCRDCDYWIPGFINDNDDFIPPKCGKYQQMVGHSADDYCSYAERREVSE